MIAHVSNVSLRSEIKLTEQSWLLGGMLNAGAAGMRTTNAVLPLHMPPEVLDHVVHHFFAHFQVGKLPKRAVSAGVHFQPDRHLVRLQTVHVRQRVVLQHIKLSIKQTQCCLEFLSKLFLNKTFEKMCKIILYLTTKLTRKKHIRF